MKEGWLRDPMFLFPLVLICALLTALTVGLSAQTGVGQFPPKIQRIMEKIKEGKDLTPADEKTLSEWQKQLEAAEAQQPSGPQTAKTNKTLPNKIWKISVENGARLYFHLTSGPADLSCNWEVSGFELTGEGPGPATTYKGTLTVKSIDDVHTKKEDKEAWTIRAKNGAATVTAELHTLTGEGDEVTGPMDATPIQLGRYMGWVALAAKFGPTRTECSGDCDPTPSTIPFYFEPKVLHIEINGTQVTIEPSHDTFNDGNGTLTGKLTSAGPAPSKGPAKPPRKSKTTSKPNVPARH